MADKKQACTFKAKPVEKLCCNDVESIYFDLTIVADKDNNITIIDNQEVNWVDLVDGDTTVVKHVKAYIV
jgi:hypothetical protein